MWEYRDDEYYTVGDYFYVNSLRNSLQLWPDLDEQGIGIDLVDLTDHIFKHHDLAKEVQAVR
jgi:hypothetical protein